MCIRDSSWVCCALGTIRSRPRHNGRLRCCRESPTLRFSIPTGTDPSDISLLSLGKDLAEDLDVMLRTATSIATRQKAVTNDKRGKAVEALLIELGSITGVKASEAVMKEVKQAKRKALAMAMAAKKGGLFSVAMAAVSSPNEAEYSKWAFRPSAADLKMSKMVRLIKEAKNLGVHLHRPTIIEAAESTLKKLKEQMTSEKKKGEEVSSDDEAEEEEAEEEEEEGDDDDGGDE